MLETLRHNARELAGAAARVERARLPAGLDRMTERFDLIFADPPYAFDDHGELLRRAHPRLLPGGEMAIEHPVAVEPEVPDGWLCHDRRRYGDSGLTFLRCADGSEEPG